MKMNPNDFNALVDLYKSGKTKEVEDGAKSLIKKFPKEINPGDIIYGLPSSGPHSNGFTLIRKLLELEAKDKGSELKKSLMIATRLYSDFAQDPVILNI